MKNFMLFMVLFSTSLMFASFPVNKDNVKKAEANVETTTIEVESANINSSTTEIVASEDALTPIAAAGYDKWVAVAFWFFLGWPFAAHRWYAKKPVWANILFIITFGGLGIWAIIDLVNILTDNF
ncbi:TM2 domain-containing protein [Psychroflexus sp. ALD_RP9]|uniref:TM2 domain-containing protein n=1 Tax=Psychroflexus sp. ALD_RP9 TaxID=2777186 RepID=UPI001A8E29C8|nr:TM2 domain-containing protein [Psychroflexus sp. ALD_RP9]QSS96073.1 TM2 domain-containing protein [Psychroflexus sp. ALD_RP9]